MSLAPTPDVPQELKDAWEPAMDREIPYATMDPERAIRVYPDAQLAIVHVGFGMDFVQKCLAFCTSIIAVGEPEPDLTMFDVDCARKQVEDALGLIGQLATAHQVEFRPKKETL